MEICDFGTKGLGGPLSAAKSFNENESIDFVNFVKTLEAIETKLMVQEHTVLVNHLYSNSVNVILFS